MKISKPGTKVKLAVLLSGVLALNVSYAAPYTFTQAWQQVLQNNDALNAKKAGIDRARNLQEAKKDLYLPDISISASYTRLAEPISMDLKDLEPLASTDLSTIPLPPSLAPLVPMMAGMNTVTDITNNDIATSSIKAVWPIFTGGRITAAQDIARSQTEEAQYILAMEEQSRFEDLSKIYFGVVLSQQVLDTRREVEQGLKEHLDHAIKLEEQGQIARIERLQAEVSYDKARVERQKVFRNLEIAQAALTSMLKQSERSTPVSGLFTNRSIPVLDEFTRKTLSDYPGLGILTAKEKQANGLISVEKGSYYPKVFLFGNYSIYEDNSLASKMAPDWAVGVGVSLPLIDSAGRSGKIAAAYSAVDQVGYLRAQAERDLALLVEKNYRSAMQSLEEYQSLASSLALARENVRLREKSFRQGLSTSLDVVDAELFLASVKTQRSVAAYQYVISLSRLLAVSGDMNRFSEYQNNSEVVAPL